MLFGERVNNPLYAFLSTAFIQKGTKILLYDLFLACDTELQA